MSGIEAVAHALAGSTGGIVAMTLLYPLENIRTRLQVQVKKRECDTVHSASEVASSAAAAVPAIPHTCGTAVCASASPEECISPETPLLRPSKAVLNAEGEKFFPLHAPRVVPLATCSACLAESSSSVTIASPSSATTYEFDGSLDVVRQVCAREGWHKLYSGLESALIGVGASSAVYFFWYYTFKSAVLAHTQAKTMGPLSNLAVASVAGVVNVFMTLPIWLVNTRITVAARGEYTGVWDAIRKIHAEDGLGGFYRGLAPSLILVSNPAIQFVVYEQMIALWTRAAQKAALRAVEVAGTAAAAASATNAPVRLSSFQYFILGAFAKAVATVVTYPYQVIKSRLQASRAAHQTTWSALTQMWREEGPSSFYQGMSAKMSQTVLNSAFMFAVYETLVRRILQFLRWLAGEYRGLPKPLP